ncbi:lysoplasmalogenase [Microbulbifer agarilyticus]|uniref:lysoplasmalogenase n=1 Tax=Microbulbifer agarilyticus TaxID=260552 RepID=UPI001C974B1B|nr:lysoplasmalogenase [Microbulbifer agarilyticus]MBY6191038.1 lysoplasmalogenase [Microbulbifer agarilyticus]MBY6211644.1 lysoplasmalogenase [Microbulbifer agarilyticus]MCA0893337.1 lysoplasmalogenase [Microbulbifer agarilyticus]
MSEIAMTSPSTTTSKSAPLAVFAVSALVYIALRAAGIEALWMAALKIVPIATLFWIAATSLAGLTRTLTLVALAFSATGDVLLAVPFANHFVFGLGAFLLAQLTYAGNFLRDAQVGSRRFMLRGTALVLAALLLGRQVLPGAGELALPVAFYIVAIVFMALSAAAHRSGSSLLFAGAVTFMVSDALIALDRFVDPVPMAGMWIMLTYYGAQALLVMGLIRTDLAARQA